MLTALTLAPCDNRSFTISLSPPKRTVARCKGVNPSVQFAFILAPFEMRNSTTSLFPLSTALYRGVAEDASLASIFAPLLINRFTSFRFPCLAASFKGPAFVTAPKKNNEKMTTAVIFKFCPHVNITHLLAFEFAQEKRRRRNKVRNVEKRSEPLHQKGIAFSIRRRRKECS